MTAVVMAAVVMAAVVMAAVIVFATVLFTGRPDTKPFVSAFTAHLIGSLEGFFLRGKGIAAVRLFSSNAGGVRDEASSTAAVNLFTMSQWINQVRVVTATPKPQPTQLL